MHAQVEASPRDMRRIMMRGRKVAAWRRLSLPERDVLTVVGAICKVLSLFLNPCLSFLPDLLCIVEDLAGGGDMCASDTVQPAQHCVSCHASSGTDYDMQDLCVLLYLH